MSKVDINSLYSFGKNIKKMSEDEQLTALNNYLVKNDLTVKIAKRMLDIYSREYKLDFEYYSYGMYANLFAGYAMGAFFGFKHLITGVIVFSIACILVGLDILKRIRLRNVSQMNILLDHIDMKLNCQDQ